MAPTIWPAGETLTCSRPPDSAVIDCATPSAPDCRPGKPFGPMVTILSSPPPWAMAGMGKAGTAATPTVAPATNWRRSMVSPPVLAAGRSLFVCQKAARIETLPLLAGSLIANSKALIAHPAPLVCNLLHTGRRRRLLRGLGPYSPIAEASDEMPYPRPHLKS